MHRIFTACSLLFFFYFSIAQQPAAARWVGSKIGISLGGDIEMPHGLDHDYLLGTAGNADFKTGGLSFGRGELVNMDCDNPTFRFSLSLLPAGQENTEWQFSLLSIEDRIDKVRYELPEDDSRGRQFLEVSAANKETAVEAVFLKKSQGSKALVFYGGPGINIGYSHGGKVRVQGYFQEVTDSDVPASEREVDLTYDQKNSINQRIFIQAGMGVHFLKRLEAGFELRKGLGYRASFGGPFNMTVLKRSIGLSLKYSFRSPSI